ncbi:1-acyl-sn-glycerol-3-phosphate acyltransferase [Lysobacter dokdonensis DS-58]|uniref:1-acyl-sn-glycerol-3-phosphate acyltransferase n=1 Tax=Lysobacter dokdonensis DS-58 TaxID=1300345 RepID=A0A0A2WHQ9_9GAMM|nr:lysophospholipid acyltransferase family protein [Lysobacter dokdonensis]KGQ18237.1 1-acyl-sn-glycerol-3-phosphate acyltransferase [Lysobacter dokdonensis DS-58]
MFAGMLAAGFRFAIRAITGARAIWRAPPSRELCVYYGNHSSHGDFVLLWSALPPALRGTVRPVAGADYWNRGALRRYIIRAVFNGVLIDRDAAQRTHDPIDTLCEAIDGGHSLILFPEGTRNPGDGLLPFKSGLYHLARKRAEVDFVPVWLENLARVMPKGKILPLPLLCTATFGEPLRLRDHEEKQAFLDRARDALLALAPRNGSTP